MYGVMLIAVLVVTGGAIAFIGDRLGTKIGKKRLSIFGLRPRHTSMVITVFTGICITTLTFAVMAVVSENVRTALFGMDELNGKLAGSRTALERVTSELEVAEADKIRTNAALEETHAEMEKLANQQEELEQTVASLRDESRQLEEAKAELTERNRALAEKNDALAAQTAELTQNNLALSENNDKLSADNKSLEERNDSLRNGLISMREGAIAFHAGEVIATGVVRGNRGEDEVAKDMSVLLNVAGRNVTERTGVYTSDNEVWVYPADYEAAIDKIAQSPRDMIVRVVAAGNLLRGEPVRTSLSLYPNSIIFRKDEFIIARMYNLQGRQDEAEQAVMSLLQAVNAVSVQKGILPDPMRGTVGAMEGTQFYEVVDALAPIKGQVVLSAYARDDTDALGPLRLNLKMEQEIDGDE